MRVKVANRLLEAYPVENCIYEVSYCGKKNFICHYIFGIDGFG